MMEMFKNVLRRLKRYDLGEMKDLQNVAKALRYNIDCFYDNESAGSGSKAGTALAIMFNMSYIEKYYPLETYIAVYSIYEKELKEVIEYLNSANVVL
jgi:hypothetical protein